MIKLKRNCYNQHSIYQIFQCLLIYHKNFFTYKQLKNLVLGKFQGKNPFIFEELVIYICIRHLIRECYFTVGDGIFIQTIGIPMGIDPAPFWANLYLYKFENSFMESLRRSDFAKSRKFHGCARFIDDLVCLNDGGAFSSASILPGLLRLMT